MTASASMSKFLATTVLMSGPPLSNNIPRVRSGDSLKLVWLD